MHTHHVLDFDTAEIIGLALPSGAQTITSPSGTYLVTTEDDVVICNGTFTVSLPSAVDMLGRSFTVKNIGTGTITVDPNDSETIDDGLTAVLRIQYGSITFISDGTEWWII